ncbi:MAG: sugar-binding transcriptional regulator [Longicatena sp.]
MKQADENTGLMVEMAYLYYEKQMSQQEIADMLFFSRSKVSRLLTQAMSDKIVEVSINYPLDRCEEIELKMKKIFNLNEVIIIKNYYTSKEILLKRIGKAAAQYLDEIITYRMPIGITWGGSVYHTVEAMKPKHKKDIEVIQMMGVTYYGKNSAYNSPELLRLMVEKYGGSCSQIYSPLVVENDIVRDSLMREPVIKWALEQARKVEVVLTSVGEFYNSKTMAWEEHLTEETKRRLMRENTAGVLLAHFINKEGKLADKQLDKQVIGISLEDLKKIPNVVLVAAGEIKKTAVLGALRGGYVNTLIIDEKLAKSVLSLYECVR